MNLSIKHIYPIILHDIKLKLIKNKLHKIIIGV